MREILFKAKRCRDRKWIEGYLYRLSDDTSPFIMLKNKHGEGYAVDPETICQYTGLTDSNGAKVFEGDILKFTDMFGDVEWTGRMEFGNPNAGYTWGWQLVHLSGEEANVDTLCWFDTEESGAYSEVIGNIHDKEE